MIEKEFKDLVNKLELSEDIKKELNALTNIIIDTIKDNILKSIKLFELTIDEPIKENFNLENERKVDLIVSIGSKNKVLPYELLKRASMNEIENVLIFNLKNNLLFKDKSSEIIRDLDNDLLRIVINENNVFNFHFRYKKDSLLKDELVLNQKSLYLENYYIQKMFENEMIKKYPKFKNTVKIIINFMKEINMKINLELLKVILSFSLDNYYLDSNYIEYLKSFIKGLTDFIDRKTITIKNEYKEKFKVYGNYKIDDHYIVIDSSNNQNNLAKDIIDISMFKKLKSLIISKFPKDGAFVSIDCTPKSIINGKTIAWEFCVLNSENSNSGGEYEYNDDNYYMCCYRACLKGLQYVVKNKMGNNIIIICENIAPFTGEKLSYENESRFANVLAFIKDNDLAVEYKKK